METTLTLRQHPAWLREQSGRNGEYPVNYALFEEIMRDFSRLKMTGELSSFDTEDFKNDLLRNYPATVIEFIEKIIQIPQLHPFVHLLLFEVVKRLALEDKISLEKHNLLCEKLLKERSCEISTRYNLEKVSILLLATI